MSGRPSDLLINHRLGSCIAVSLDAVVHPAVGYCDLSHKSESSDSLLVGTQFCSTWVPVRQSSYTTCIHAIRVTCIKQ